MDNKNIGIIIQRQDNKILLYDDNYYIKTRIYDNESIEKTIEKALEKVIDNKLFKIKNEYEEINEYKNITPFQAINDIYKMYLVEVCVYNEVLPFLTKGDLYEKLYSCPQKLFYEKYILRYDKYKNFLQCVFTSIVIIFITIIIVSNTDILRNQILIMFIYLTILATLCFYLLGIPRITTHILNYIINEKILQYSNISSIMIGVLSVLIIYANKW